MSIVQKALDFKSYIGVDLYKEFSSFLRMDKFSNENYTYAYADAIDFISRMDLANGVYFTKEEIKAAYRRLVKIHHPDRGGIQDNFIKLNNAYEVLKEYYNI